jgi:hypothetical protein
MKSQNVLKNILHFVYTGLAPADPDEFYEFFRQAKKLDIKGLPDPLNDIAPHHPDTLPETKPKDKQPELDTISLPDEGEFYQNFFLSTI